jgi:hypothetical protein
MTLLTRDLTREKTAQRTMSDLNPGNWTGQSGNFPVMNRAGFSGGWLA